jgi:hypothetical protein
MTTLPLRFRQWCKHNTETNQMNLLNYVPYLFFVKDPKVEQVQLVINNQPFSILATETFLKATFEPEGEVFYSEKFNNMKPPVVLMDFVQKYNEFYKICPQIFAEDPTATDLESTPKQVVYNKKELLNWLKSIYNTKELEERYILSLFQSLENYLKFYLPIQIWESFISKLNIELNFNVENNKEFIMAVKEKKIVNVDWITLIQPIKHMKHAIFSFTEESSSFNGVFFEDLNLFYPWDSIHKTKPSKSFFEFVKCVNNYYGDQMILSFDKFFRDSTTETISFPYYKCK